MRILVTGHLGYIGTVLVPMLLGRGHQVVGLDTRPLRRVHVHRHRADGAEHRARRARRARRRPGRLRRDRPPRRALQRPAGRPQPRAHRTRSTTPPRCAWPALAKDAGVPRFLFSSSCSKLRRGRRRRRWTRTAPLAPLTAYAELQGAGRARRGQLADGAFSPTYLRNATAYGVSPRLRFDLVLNNLVAWAHATGRVPDQERRHAVAPASSTSRTSRARSSPCWRRRATSCTTRRSTWAVSDGELPRARPRRDRARDGAGLAGRVRDGRRPGPALLPGGLRHDRRGSSPASRRSGRRGRAPGELSTPTAPRTSAEDVEGPRYTRIEHLRRLLDAAPRRHAPLERAASARGSSPTIGCRDCERSPAEPARSRPAARRSRMAACRFCRAAARPHARRPRRCRRSARASSPAERAQPDGAVLSAARLRLRRSASSSSSRSTCGPRTSSPSTRTSRPTRTAGCAHARALRGRWSPTARPRPRAASSSRSASNDGYLLQYFVARGIPVAGHRAGARTSPRPRAARGVPTAGRVLRAGDRARTGRATGRGPTS